jgi:two-component system cell cycle response regulator
VQVDGAPISQAGIQESEPGEPARRPLKVLAAEDNPVFQTMLKNLLIRWGYDVVIARDGNEAWDILQSECAPRLAILDWMMPGMDGVELCRKARSANREPYTYILLLTARTESEDLVNAMEAGADDYLTKPLKAHELRARLRAGRRIIELQEDLVGAREALRQQATHDSLTGLLNRASILAGLHNELERGARERHPVSLLIADLDRFKLINDTWGHLTGDAVLFEAARRMKSAIRRYDSIGRYGGEEFLIVLPGCDCASAQSQAERIREAVAGELFHAGPLFLQVTCSIGVSSRTVAMPADADNLVREADTVLYRAKDNGRNRVEVYAAPT